MTHSIKMAMAAIALTSAAGFAIAQGTPPNTTSPNPATAAGQQSQQNTPMGTTGTPATNQGTMSGSTGSTTTNQATTSPSTTPDMTNQGGSMRVARADRN
ncbi:proteophosphoglycan ppg4 [Variovorax sp. DXTD-1]|uniref:proteophosphoglycan ppg4 n=1 Tax=Variovorax sp. DXTD-1 TaxID=2495592 RepID=UPI000F8903B0|nr:proteophosphoglycan ppg4 [Variovorax sp. DXTD-1]RST48308.1 proteophosphoglycan ppg4 [Variovorax sp. DXTD-1]